MAKEYGTLPSTISAMPAGDFLLNLDVFGIGCEIDNRVNKLAHDKNGSAKAKAYLQGLTNRAKAYLAKKKRDG